MKVLGYSTDSIVSNILAGGNFTPHKRNLETKKVSSSPIKASVVLYFWKIELRGVGNGIKPPI